MKTKIFKHSLLSGVGIWIGVAVLAGNDAQAVRVPELSQLFGRQIGSTLAAVQSCALAEGAEVESWQMTAFYLDVNPYVSVGIPGVLQIQVAPEIEFVWTEGGSD